jgi:predicted DNA-binding WGR domain protein
MKRLANIASRVAAAFMSGWLKTVFRDLELLLTNGEGADRILSRSYMTFEYGTSSKFHAFMVCSYTDDVTGDTVYVGGNAYGRMGKTARAMAVARGASRGSVMAAVEKKERAKERKGYDMAFNE